MFYLDEYTQVSERPLSHKYDIAFIGTAHLDRLPVLLKLKQFCRQNSVKSYFFIYLQDLKIYYLRKLFYKSFRQSRKNDFELTPLKKEEIKAIINTTNCVLDVEKTVQSGLTIRAIETLGARRKLITTNKTIKDYDFFDEKNIFIIGKPNNSPRLSQRRLLCYRSKNIRQV